MYIWISIYSYRQCSKKIPGVDIVEVDLEVCIFGQPYRQAVGRLFWAHVVENEYRHPYRQAIGDALTAKECERSENTQAQ